MIMRQLLPNSDRRVISIITTVNVNVNFFIYRDREASTVLIFHAVN